MREFLCDTALVPAAREARNHLLQEDKSHDARQDRHRPAGEQRKARAQRGADEENGKGQKNPGDGGNAVAHGADHPSDAFPMR